MREIDPDIEIVLMTAYTDKSLSEIVRGMTSLHKLLYMRKPFSREEIQQITLSLVGKWNIQKALSRQAAPPRRQLSTLGSGPGCHRRRHGHARMPTATWCSPTRVSRPCAA